MKFIKSDWGLKLLALILAIVVYYAIKESSAVHNYKINDRIIFQQPN